MAGDIEQMEQETFVGTVERMHVEEEEKEEGEWGDESFEIEEKGEEKVTEKVVGGKEDNMNKKKESEEKDCADNIETGKEKINDKAEKQEDQEKKEKKEKPERDYVEKMEVDEKGDDIELNTEISKDKEKNVGHCELKKEKVKEKARTSQENKEQETDSKQQKKEVDNQEKMEEMDIKTSCSKEMAVKSREEIEAHSKETDSSTKEMAVKSSEEMETRKASDSSDKKMAVKSSEEIETRKASDSSGKKMAVKSSEEIETRKVSDSSGKKMAVKSSEEKGSKVVGMEVIEIDSGKEETQTEVYKKAKRNVKRDKHTERKKNNEKAKKMKDDEKKDEEMVKKEKGKERKKELKMLAGEVSNEDVIMVDDEGEDLTLILQPCQVSCNINHCKPSIKKYKY